MTPQEIVSKHEAINNELYQLNLREEQLYRQLEDVKQKRHNYDMQVRQLITMQEQLKKPIMTNERI